MGMASRRRKPQSCSKDCTHSDATRKEYTMRKGLQMMARVGKGHWKGRRALLRWLGFPGGAGEEGKNAGQDGGTGAARVSRWTRVK